MAEQTKLRVLIDVVGEQQLGKLRQTLTQVESSTGKLGNTFAKARVELKRQEQATKASINSTRAFRDSFRELANSVEFGSAKFKIATREAERLDKQLAKMEKRKPAGGGMRGAAQIAGTVAGAGVFGGFEGAAGALIGAPFGPGGAIVGGAIGAQVGQLRQAAGAAAEYAAALQKQRIALVGVTTSNAEYATALDAITQATQDYALPQDVVTRQFTKLQASVQGAGGNIDDTKAAFDGIVSAVRATGGSLNDVDAALTATAQVFSKGKVSAEELRQQIGERLPGAFTLFAESIGKTPAELDKALEKGEVSLLDFLKFVKQNIERYKENAKAIADSPAAAGDRLKRDLANLSESVGRLLAPIGAAFQDIFSEIVKVITRATNALARFFNLAFDQAKYEQALMTIADYEASEMAGGLPTGRGGRAREQAYKRAKEMVALQTSLMQGPGAGVVRPEQGTGLPGIDLDGTGGAGGASARQDLTAGQLEARRALRAATEAEAIIRLEYESKVLDIMERQLLPLEKIDALEQAKEARDKRLEQLQQRRAQALEKERLELQKAMDAAAKGMKDSFDAMYLSTAAVAEGEEAKGPFAFIVKGAQELADEIKNIGSAAQEVAKVGLKGLGDALTELVVNGTLNFREFAASLLRDMARIIMQTIVVKSLMQAIGALGPTVSPMPNMTGAEMFKGPRYDLGFVPAMAKGGITQGLSIAGEAGPEAVVPLPDGRSIPVTMQGGAGNVVVNVDAKGTSVQGDSTRSNALGDAIGSAVRQELLRQRRPGGLLA